MTISVIQARAFNANSSGSFSSNVTAGNSVILIATGASNGVSMSSSSPLFNGSAAAGAALVVDENSPLPAGSAVYVAIWLLPDLAGGAASVGLTVANNAYPYPSTGLIGLEVAGLGTSPASDQTQKTAGATASVTSGTTGTTTTASELVVASLISFGQTFSDVGSPWTELQFGSDFSIAGYQVVSATGAFTYSQTASGAAGNAGIIATFKAAGAPGPPAKATSVSTAVPAGADAATVTAFASDVPAVTRAAVSVSTVG